MKKILTISMLAATLAGTSAFGQGFFKFASGKSEVYDGFTTASTSALSTHVDVALLWAAANTASPFAIASTPTSGNSATAEAFTAAQAWAALTSSTFTSAQSAAIGGAVQSATLANGSVSFNGGGNFDITGTTTSTAYTLMLVSWNGSLYSTLAAAEAAGTGAIGFSAPLQVTSGLSALDQTVTSMPFAGFGTFVPATIPEPGTMALAALGGASLLLFRRKK